MGKKWRHGWRRSNSKPNVAVCHNNNNDGQLITPTTTMALSDAPIPATVQHIWAMAVCFAQNYDKEADPEHLVEHFFKPFHDFLVDTCLEDNGSFFDGTLYTLLVRSMPHVMQHIKEEIEMWEGLSDDDGSRSSFFRELFIAAFTVGDGCLYTREDGWIYQELAIKDLEDGDIHVKRYLRRYGWDDKHHQLGLRRDINTNVMIDRYSFFANGSLLSFKKRVWQSIMAFSSLTPSGMSGRSNQFYSLARKTLAEICSGFNQTHGCYLPMSFFLDDFRQNTKIPCMFDICVSGMLATDGSVGSVCGLMYRIFQSNQRFIVALATVMKEKYGVNPRVTGVNSKTIRWRPKYRIYINSEDTRKLLPRVASFDLNRADQHLVLLLRIMADEARGVPNRRKVQAFLRGLAKYIRNLHPS